MARKAELRESLLQKKSDSEIIENEESLRNCTSMARKAELRESLLQKKSDSEIIENEESLRNCTSMARKAELRESLLQKKSDSEIIENEESLRNCTSMARKAELRESLLQKKSDSEIIENEESLRNCTSMARKAELRESLLQKKSDSEIIENEESLRNCTSMARKAELRESLLQKKSDSEIIENEESLRNCTSMARKAELRESLLQKKSDSEIIENEESLRNCTSMARKAELRESLLQKKSDSEIIENEESLRNCTSMARKAELRESLLQKKSDSEIIENEESLRNCTSMARKAELRESLLQKKSDSEIIENEESLRNCTSMARKAELRESLLQKKSDSEIIENEESLRNCTSMARKAELRESLLQKKSDSEIIENEESLRKRVWEESKKIWVIAGPAIFTRLSSTGIVIATQAFVGHIGSTQLAGYALVITVLFRFITGILIGMASPLETLCGQAYGAKQYHMLGVYLQRFWIVLSLTIILLLPLFIFTAPILEALGQEKDIAEMAGKISLWSIGLAFAMIISFTCQTFLQAQSKNVIIAYLAAFSIVVHLLLSWLLIVKLGFGVNGAMLSLILSSWLPNIGQLIFIMTKCHDTWKGFSLLAFKDLWPSAKLSLSAGVMMCLEIWYNTILVLLTGNFKDAKIAISALSICLNINGWEMMIALGFFAVAGVRVANELGRGSSRAAKFSIVMIVLTSFAIGFVLFLVFLFLKEKLAYVFTSDHDVVATVGDLSLLLALSILLNSIQPVLSGVSVGAGWQSIVAYINIGCYYVIGIPVGIVIGVIFNYEVKGVWIGMLFGVFVQTVTLIIMTCKTDWKKQVEIAQRNINKWATNKTQESNGSGTSLLANEE